MSSTIQITSAQLIIALISAAGFGALVSASIVAFSQWRERVSRRKELLLTKAIDMAQKTTDLLFKIGQESGGGQLYPEIVTARWYHRQLSLLFHTSKIGPDLEKEFADYITGSHLEIEKRWEQNPPKRSR